MDRPIFLFGMPRSGTTLVFESIARIPALGWFSYHFARFPRFPPISIAARLCDLSPMFRKAVTRSEERRPWLEPFRDGPAEAYNLWEQCCGEKFSYDYLLEQRASPDERAALHRIVSQVLRWQGKDRFAAKITGPSRIGYLKSVFEDAQFVHVVRDGRAVVNSLLRVDFWRDSFRMREPAWRGGFKPEYVRRWEESGRDPLVLAALQWRNVIEQCDAECERHRPRVFLEIRYEDFLSDPVPVVERICEATDLEFASSAKRWLTEGGAIDRSQTALSDCFSGEEIATLDGLLGDVLERFGYTSES